MSPNEKLYLALVLFMFSAFTVTLFTLSMIDSRARAKEAAAKKVQQTTSMPRGAIAH